MPDHRPAWREEESDQEKLYRSDPPTKVTERRCAIVTRHANDAVATLLSNPSNKVTLYPLTVLCHSYLSSEGTATLYSDPLNKVIIYTDVTPSG